jgi:hypothetical protein
MQQSTKCRLEWGAVLGGLVVLVTGCGDVDSQSDGTPEPGSLRLEADPLRGHWHHRRPPSASGGATSAGGAGGTTSSGGTGTTASGGTSSGGTSSGGAGGGRVDCSYCTITQACCLAVEQNPSCSFSADTCFSLDPGRQATYTNSCLTTTLTTITAWQLRGRTPPPECTMP